MHRVTALAVLTLAVVAPATALARRKASKVERTRVVAAAVGAGNISKAQGNCVRVFVSSVDRHWASIDFPWPTRKACVPLSANGVILLHRRRGTWHVVTDGSDFRCPIPHVPRRVSHDLRVAC